MLYKAKISGERLQDHWSSGFFMCGRYTNQRNDLLHDLNFIQNINLKLLLFGDVSRSIEDNTRIFEAVQKILENQKDLPKLRYIN